MNAIDLLKNDHDYVDSLFKRVEDTPPSRHAVIFKQIKNELDTHAHIEEKIFYPALIRDGNKELKEITREGLEEHSQIKKFLREIARTTSKNTREAKLKVLIEDTRHHVKEEENEMFPTVEDQFSTEQLEALGTRMEAEKLKFQKAKRIPARRQQPKGALSKVVEKAIAVVESVMGTAEEPKPSTKARGAAASKRSAGAANGRSRSKTSAVSSKPLSSKAKASPGAGPKRSSAPTSKSRSAKAGSR